GAGGEDQLVVGAVRHLVGVEELDGVERVLELPVAGAVPGGADGAGPLEDGEDLAPLQCLELRPGRGLAARAARPGLAGPGLRHVLPPVAEHRNTPLAKRIGWDAPGARRRAGSPAAGGAMPPRRGPGSGTLRRQETRVRGAAPRTGARGRWKFRRTSY